MWHLIKIEWLKIYKYRAFIILLGLFVLSVLGLNYIVNEITSMRENPLSAFTNTAFSFPKVWHTATYLSSFLLFIPGLIMILLLCNEFSFKTHRQNVIDGVSRSQFIHTKLLLALIFSLLLTLLVTLTACLFGAINGGGTFSLTSMRYIPYFFIQSILYLNVGMVFALIFKRSGISIGVYFLYIFILENVLSLILNKYLSPLGALLPLEASDNLIPVPVSLGLPDNTPGEGYLLIACLVWIIASVWFCKYKFEKHDL